MKSKNTYVIDFYNKFECIGGSCPYTCCRGWQIAVDDETYSEYKKQSFPKNAMLQALIGKKDGIRSIRKIKSECPFYTAEGLCRFQEQDKEELMPKVCRQYPRTSICFGDYNEVTLELSCIRVAELFVENIGRHRFIKSQEEIEENWTIGNNSEVFLKFLKDDRRKILDFIWNESNAFSLSRKLGEIYEYIYLENQYISRDDIEGASRINLPATTNEKSKYNIPIIASEQDELPFYPIWFLNEIIYEKLSHPNLKKNNRYLYELIKSYKRLFGDLTENEADLFFRGKMEKMLKNQPKLEQLFQAYFAYLIQQTYCKSYEDYYVLGPILLSIIDMEFVMLFMLVFYINHKHIEPADMAAILANTERAIRHNLILNDDILYKIRQRFF